MRVHFEDFVGHCDSPGVLPIPSSRSIAAAIQGILTDSQAVLGESPDAPAELLLSNGADVFPRDQRRTGRFDR
jgi:hypothetical protein